MKFINLCLSIPNLDTIIFYLIFVILIPAYLFSTSDYETLKYYLPALIMIAVTLTEAGKPDFFVNLYPNPCDATTTFSGYLSTNIINGLAVVGILSQALVITMATSSLTLGLVSGLITFAIAFPMAQTILPFFIAEVDELTHTLFSDVVTFPGNWHKYFTGFVFVVLFMTLQVILLRQANNLVLASQSGI